MGILDDAIRQHLELKRQHGAEDEDVERLEKEAFGPVARPGDPDFDTQDEPIVAGSSAEHPQVETVEQVPETGEQSLVEPPSEELEAEAPAAEAEEPDSGSFGIFDAESEFGREGEATPAERARIEHDDLEDTADHPGPAQLGPADEAEPAPSEPAPSAAEPEGAAPGRVEPEPEGAATEAPEADIFADEDFDLPDMDLSTEEGRGSGPGPSSSEDAPAGTEEGGEEGEDLLEETPDFLEESEGEDLWFEQGPPRDFDFDDD